MCGIAGFIVSSGLATDASGVIQAMITAIAHRGPDDSGFWLDQEAGVALGHRRLSILDLSPAGHQPMVSHSGRYVVVFNGEIYNHRSLKVELERSGRGVPWRGHSDTETLLAAIEYWGVEDALVRMNGMFAFAVWDSCERVLFLARDRMGEKPLYYGHANGVFLFGSELKALRRHPAFRSEVDRASLALFLRHNYVPAPHSIWRGINKLPPAHYLKVQNGGGEHEAPRCYWDFTKVAETGNSKSTENQPDSVDELEGLLKDAVGLRMEADVPLGAFLSGGIDSSTIVALMQAQARQPVRTFSIGFHEDDFNEAANAKLVANYLGTDHTELYVTSDDALNVIPKLPKIWDEPFADSSQIPTFLVSEMTRRHVTVSLSGDGGDELFGGYNRYLLAAGLWEKTAWFPIELRRFLARALCAPHTARLAAFIARALPSRYRPKAIADRLPKLARLLTTDSAQSLYHRLVSVWETPSSLVLGSNEPSTLLSRAAPPFPDLRQTMMYLDTLTYLPDDILTKVDRASMAVSLEARVPFLDHRVVELAWRLPVSDKIRNGTSKYVLRQVLYRHVPRDLVERPKMGFGLPIEAWIVGPLRDWAEQLLDERRLRREGFLEPTLIRNMWGQHVSGKRRWHFHIWNILMFQAWWEEQKLATERPVMPMRRAEEAFVGHPV